MVTPNFVDFCKTNKESILSSILMASTTMPDEINRPDYRFHISHFICHSLCREFPDGILRPYYDVGYDLLYNDKDRISIKIRKKIFQRQSNSRDGSLTLPKPVVLKNNRKFDENDSINISGLNFDYLMTIERGEVESSVAVAFGVIAKYNIKDIINNGDDITTKILNKDYDIFSEFVVANIDDNQERRSDLNEIFIGGMDGIYDKLLSY